MDELKKKLASLNEQWEAEKLGLGDVKNIREQLEQADLEYGQLEAAIRAKHASGQLVPEKDYQRLYEVEQRRKTLRKQAEETAAPEPEGKEKEKKPKLLRTEVGPEEIAHVVSAWTGVPVTSGGSGAPSFKRLWQ